MRRAEIKVQLATMARGYTWELLDPAEGWLTFPLARPERGMPLRFAALGAEGAPDS